MNYQDRTRDSQADSAEDGRWLTFAELSQLRGISKTAAMKLVSRHGWRRQKNNKGQVRALVPVAWVTDADTREPSSAADMSRAIRAFDSAIATLRQQLVRETGRTEAAERARTALMVQLAQAEAGRAAERSRAEADREALTRAEAEAVALRAQLDQARAEAQQATQAAEAEAARLQRARRSWRSKRPRHCGRPKQPAPPGRRQRIGRPWLRELTRCSCGDFRRRSRLAGPAAGLGGSERPGGRNRGQPLIFR
jgi:septal ring factor EnvC (AmiA/AmiB activator)